MARELDPDELIDRWTLVEDELELVAGKHGSTRLGFTLLLRFYIERGRFPVVEGSYRMSRSSTSRVRSV